MNSILGLYSSINIRSQSLTQISIPLLVLSTFIALTVALFATYKTKGFAVKNKIGTFPDQRMIHTGFIPLLGGIGIVCGFLTGIILNYLFFHSSLKITWHYFYIIIAALLVMIMGIYDDIKGLNAIRKFTGQFAASTLVIFSGCIIDTVQNPFGPDIYLGYFSIPLTYLWLIGVTNAVNLLDGLDGLAAGVCAIASVIFSIISVYTGNYLLLLFYVSLAAGIFGFLRFNYHPASIFMGDTGSMFLGFILAALSLKTFENSSTNVAMLLPVVALAVPIGDTSVAFFRRLNRGNHPFKPDKDHLHHRLIYLGLTHSQAVYLIYFITMVYGITAVLLTTDAQVFGFLMLILSIILSAVGLKRLGYLEAKKIKTIYGDESRFKVGKELAPLSMQRFLHRIITGFTDVITINISTIIFVWFRYKFGLISHTTLSFSEVIVPRTLILITVTWIILFVLNDLYDMAWDVSRFDKIRRVSKTILFGVLLFFLITWDAQNVFTQSRLSIIIYALLMIILVNTGRLIIITIEKKWSVLEYAPQTTLLVGATEKSRKLLKNIRKNKHLLYNIIGFVSKDGKKESFSDLKSLGSYKDIPEIVRIYGVHEIIIAINERSRDEILGIVSLVDNMKVVFKIIPEFYDVVSGHKTQEIIGHPLIKLFPDHMHLWQWIVKRFVDILLSLALLVLVLPIGIMFYILLLAGNVHPALKIVNSVGKNGKIFGMLNYNVYKKRNWVQKVLYKSNLYKFPELINIIMGTMSIIGPRPETYKDVSEMQKKIRFYNRRFQVRPGLTGWAQVKYRYDDSLKSRREQYKQDLFYLENMSITFDFRILLRSLYILLFNKYK